MLPLPLPERLAMGGEIRQIGEVTYYNDGDWVESCTALVEDAQGVISIVDWAAICFEEAQVKTTAAAEAARTREDA
jgi:hypothetical protein